MTNPFPAFLLLKGRAVLVVGAGPVAASKMGILLEAGARVTVVAPLGRPSRRRAHPLQATEPLKRRASMRSFLTL